LLSFGLSCEETAHIIYDVHVALFHFAIFTDLPLQLFGYLLQ
jgi:hypothetical protein